MRKIVRYVASLIFVFAIFNPLYAGATTYIVRTSSSSEENRVYDKNITGSDGKKFVWNTYAAYDSSHAGFTIFYFDGNSSSKISNNLAGFDDNGVINGNYIAYISHYYDGSSPQVFVYNIQTSQRTQITNDSEVKDHLDIKNGKLTWEEYSSGNGYDLNIWLYDINSTALTQVTNDGSQSSLNQLPHLTNNKLYWAKAKNHLYELDFNNNQIVEITQTGDSINQIITDGNNVAWTSYDTNFSDTDLYYYNGNTSTRVTNDNYSDQKINMKGNFLVWLSFEPNAALKAYNPLNGTTQIIAADGNDINTDGQRIVYWAPTQIHGSNYDEEPFVKDMTTGQTIQISFPYGYIFNSSLMIVDSDFVAWAGYQTQGSGTQPTHIYIAEPAVAPSAPTNLVATSPTNQKPQLSWNSVSTAISYNIYRNNNLVGSSTTTSFIDSVLTTNGTYIYAVTAVGQSNLESLQSNSVSVIYDTTLPSGAFTGSPVTIRFLGQHITGTAADTLSGVAKVEITSGSVVLSSTSGQITLSCNASATSCTWDANPTALTTGHQTLTLQVTDKAGNIFTTTKNYTII